MMGSSSDLNTDNWETPTMPKPTKKARRKSKPRKHARKNGARKASRKVSRFTRQRPVKRVTARVNTIQFKIGPKKNIRNVRLMPRGKQGSAYKPLLDEIASKLRKRGDLFEVDIPKGLSSRVFHNRVNAMLRRVKPKLPGGLRVEKSTVEGGKKIALVAVK